VLVAGILVGVAIGQRKNVPTPTVQMDDWDIPRLVAYLNGKGLGLRLISTYKDGAVGPAAFLTTTDKSWTDLNRLQNDPELIDMWQGILHCDCGRSGEYWSSQKRRWCDCCAIVGPFLLYGDRELLGRVCAALAAGSPSA
jgi:hypothetical protein